jgi:SAM-dependent methyltransferase
LIVAAPTSPRTDAKQIAQERAPPSTDAPLLAGRPAIEVRMTSPTLARGAHSRRARQDIGRQQQGLRDRTSASDSFARFAPTPDKEGLKNVKPFSRAARLRRILPDSCCDAMFMRDVYHHVTAPEAFNRSLFASLKPGGRLAILDFRPEPGSK